MQVQSSQCTQNKSCSQNGNIGYVKKQYELEGNAQKVVESLKLNTIDQIGKKINKDNHKIYNKSKHRQLNKEMSGYDIQNINAFTISQKEYNQSNAEQFIDKQKFTAGITIIKSQNQSNSSQNHQHLNTYNEQILNKLLVKGESVYEKDQCRSASFSNNFQSLNQLQNQQNGGIILNQIGQQGIIGINSDQTLDQDNNQINEKININYSNNSISGLESYNEFERKNYYNKNIKSNQTLTTFTTQMNTQYSVTHGHLIPSLSHVSKCGSNILSKQRSKTSSFLSKNPSLVYNNIGNINDNLIQQPLEENMQKKNNNVNQENQISQNNISQNSQINISQNKTTQNNISLINIPQNIISLNNIQQDNHFEINFNKDSLKNIQSNNNVIQTSFQENNDNTPKNVINTYLNFNDDNSPLNISLNSIKQINKQQNDITINQSSNNNIIFNDISNNTQTINNISISDIPNNNKKTNSIKNKNQSNENEPNINIKDNNLAYDNKQQNNTLQNNFSQNNIQKTGCSQSSIQDNNKSYRNLITQNNNDKDNDQLDNTHDIHTTRQFLNPQNNQFAVSDSSQIVLQQTKEQAQNSPSVKKSLSQYQQVLSATKNLMEKEQQKQSKAQQNQKQQTQNSNFNQNQQQKQLKMLQLNTSEEIIPTANNQNILQQPQKNNQIVYNKISLNKVVKTISDFDIKTAKSQINLDLNLNCHDSLTSSNKASYNIKNTYNINQQSTQNPRSGPSTIPSIKVTGKLEIENMDYMQHLRGGIHFVPGQPKTTYTTDIQSMNKDYVHSYCQNPSLQETKRDIENNVYLNDIDLNNIFNLNSFESEQMKTKCKSILDQISQCDQNNVQNVTKLLQKYIKQDIFMKFLIFEAQRPIYNKEINFKLQFQFKPDSFLKDVVVQEIKKLEKNQMLAFADRQIECSAFFKILQSFYLIFHSIFLKIIIFYLVSCLTIFSLYFTNQSVSLILWSFIVIVFLIQIILSFMYNFYRCLQDNNYSQYIFFFFCGIQIVLVSTEQYLDDRPLEEQTYSIVSRSAQIFIDLALSWYFYNMNRAARLFLLCFKILQN